jgi:hypothetical protein
MIQSAVLGNLSVQIGGNVSGLDKAAGKAGAIIGKLERSINTGAEVLGAYAFAAVSAGAALAVHLTSKSLDTIDVQSKLAHRLNGTVAELQALVLAGDLAGVSQNLLAKNVGKMNQRMAEAARTGSGPTYEALKRIGLGASEFLALPVNERLAVLADRFKALGYTTAQQSDVLREFGVRNQELISLFEGGGDAIRSASKDVQAFGIAVSDIDAAAIEVANDAWTTAKLTFTGVGNQLAVHLAPLLKEVADQLADAGREGGGFGDAIAKGVGIAVIGFGRMQTEIYNTRVDFDEFVGGMIDGFNAVAGAIPKGIESATGGAVTAARLGYKDIEHGYGKLRDTLQKPPTDEEWTKWWEGLQAKAREAGQKIVNERKRANSGGGSDTGDGMDDGQRSKLQNKLDRLRKSLATEDEALRVQRENELRNLADYEAKKLVSAEEAALMRLQIQAKYDQATQDLVAQRLEAGIITEDEILARKYEKQLSDLATFEQNRTITVERAAELRRKIEEKHRLAMLQLQASQYSGMANIVDTSMGQMTDLIGTEGDKQFSIFKAISAATALVKGYEAVVSAYAAGSKLGGPAVGALFAGIAAAGVAAHIAKLMSTTIGSGGGTVSAAGGGGGGGAAAAAAAPAETAAPSRTTFVTLQGRFWGREEVRELAGQLIEYHADGGKVVLA